MRVFVLSLLAVAAAHGAAPATWGSPRMPALRTAAGVVGASVPAANLALRGGGLLDSVKEMVSVFLLASTSATAPTRLLVPPCLCKFSRGLALARGARPASVPPSTC
jgi:hypothetical protein